MRLRIRVYSLSAMKGLNKMSVKLSQGHPLRLTFASEHRRVVSGQRIGDLSRAV